MLWRSSVSVIVIWSCILHLQVGGLYPPPPLSPSEDHQATPSYCFHRVAVGWAAPGAFGTCTRIAGLYLNLSVAGPAALWVTINPRRLWTVNPNLAPLRMSGWGRGAQGRAGVPGHGVMLCMLRWVTSSLFNVLKCSKPSGFLYSGTGWQLPSTSSSDFLAGINRHIDLTMAELSIPIPSLLPYLWEQGYYFHPDQDYILSLTSHDISFFLDPGWVYEMGMFCLCPMCRLHCVLLMHCWNMSVCKFFFWLGAVVRRVFLLKHLTLPAASRMAFSPPRTQIHVED